MGRFLIYNVFLVEKIKAAPIPFARPPINLDAKMTATTAQVRAEAASALHPFNHRCQLVLFRRDIPDSQEIIVTSRCNQCFFSEFPHSFEAVFIEVNQFEQIYITVDRSSRLNSH